MDFDMENRIVSAEYSSSEDNDIEVSLRPKSLDEYIGQDKAKENLSIYIEAARRLFGAKPRPQARLFYPRQPFGQSGGQGRCG